MQKSYDYKPSQVEIEHNKQRIMVTPSQILCVIFVKNKKEGGEINFQIQE